MREPVPLYRVQEAIYAFCRHRPDIVVFGAQAVNLYSSQPRMTQDFDLLAPRPAELAAELAQALHDRLHIAARVREIRPGVAYRIFQVRKDANRHLADVRLADFPIEPAVERDGIRYVPPALLVALKVCALTRRRYAPKGATDLADLRRLLLADRKLRTSGAVRKALGRIGADEAALRTWDEILAAPVVADEDIDEGY
ncbi:MAG: hypothetical protein QME96_08935 [Myxococcota bacterium]|nr:hypothetical protein [Myxococcota bacterium]